MSDPVAVEPVAPESDIARHLARRAVLVAPVFLVGGLIGWGQPASSRRPSGSSWWR